MFNKESVHKAPVQSTDQDGNGFWKRTSQKISDATDTVGGKISEATDTVGSKISSTANSVTDIDIKNKLRKFANEAAVLVGELDEELISNNSSYEIGDFKVRGTVGIMAGMSLDIHYVKTPTARAISDTRLKTIPITNPETGKSFNVSRVSIAGQENVNVRDPHTGDVLCIDCSTGNVLCKIETE